MILTLFKLAVSVLIGLCGVLLAMWLWLVKHDGATACAALFTCVLVSAMVRPRREDCEHMMDGLAHHKHHRR
jgi:hypothetical protein